MLKPTATFTKIQPEADPTNGSPVSRSSHGLSALNDAHGNLHRLVLYGGEHIARTPIVDANQVLWMAEKDSGGWRWISLSSSDNDGPSPPSRVAHAQAAVGHAVYIFGGRGGVDIGETALNDLWRLEVVGGCTEESGPPRAKWTKIEPTGDDLPEARSFHKMISVSTDLYVFGGCGAGGRLNDLWKYDTINNKWVNLGKSILRGRGGPNLFQLPSKENEVRLAVVAGFAGEETNDGHVYNSNTSWEAKGMDGLSNLRPRSVCAFGSLTKQKKCFLFGGEVDPSNRGHEGAGNFESDLVLLDEEGNAMDSIRRQGDEPWPNARGWSDATAVGDNFYMFGGLAGDDKTPVRLDDLWECKVATN